MSFLRTDSDIESFSTPAVSDGCERPAPHIWTRSRRGLHRTATGDALDAGPVPACSLPIASQQSSSLKTPRSLQQGVSSVSKPIPGGNAGSNGSLRYRRRSSASATSIKPSPFTSPREVSPLLGSRGGTFAFRRGAGRGRAVEVDGFGTGGRIRRGFVRGWRGLAGAGLALAALASGSPSCAWAAKASR